MVQIWRFVNKKPSPEGEGSWQVRMNHLAHRTVLCAIAVSRKLLKMIYILLEKGQYYDPNYAVKATE